MREFIYVFLISGALLFGSTQSVLAEAAVPLQKAEGEKLSIAVGHYARSRSLLIAALREFDEGLKVVNPDALLDSAAFRNTLLDKTKDLEKVLDPQPRVSKSGVRYQPDTRLLGNSKGEAKGK